jgi:hypothetical protein
VSRQVDRHARSAHASDPKAVVGRLIDGVINAGRLDIIDEIYTPQMAPAARRWISPFRESFPDVHMEVVDLIAEGEKVVGRFRGSATNLGPWRGQPPNRPPLRAPRRGSTSSASTTVASPKPGASKTPAHANDSSPTRTSHAAAGSLHYCFGRSPAPSSPTADALA